MGSAAHSGFGAVYRREMSAYVNTPSAYIFILTFVMLSVVLAFHVGGFFESQSADLTPFFSFHPWLFVVLAPALTMRAWAEEVRHGTLETLLTLPIPTWHLVAAKHAAGWTMVAVALLLTIPMWFTVNYLGAPDNFAIGVSYLMSLLAAGAFLAIGQACSAVVAHQAGAFVLSIIVGLVFTAAGAPLVTEFAGQVGGAFAADQIALFGIAARLNSAWRGVLDLGSALYFVGLMALWLTVAALFVSSKRGG